MTEGERLLNAIAMDLWRRAAGQPPQVPLPIRVFGDFATVRAVLTRHTDFAKNYTFLTDLAVGRQSVSGGAAWEGRARITRQWFHGRSIDDTTLLSIYARHLSPLLDQANGAGMDALFEVAVEAGVSVFSHMLGLSRPLPWPRQQTLAMRALLAQRMTLGWRAAAAGELAQLQHDLVQARESLRALWRADPHLANWLDALQATGRGVERFDAVEETLLGAMASSETTAASLLWCVELLGRHPQHFSLLSDSPTRQAVIDETLRLFPPVPFMTRVSTGNHHIGDLKFEPGEHIAVSLVGLHCDPARWPRPFDFEPGRWLQGHPEAAAQWMPFSRGQRVCAGMALAQRELHAALAWLHAHARVQSGARPPAMQLAVSLRPQSDTRLVPKRRSDIASA